MLELDFHQQLGELALTVNLQLPNHGITAIFGESGAGKTSLINAIGGLTRPDSGRIVLNGRRLVDIEQRVFVPPQKRHIGFVFQDARLFPHYSVKGNLQYAMAGTMQSQFDEIVALLGIGHLLKRYPITLSGGEKQRVAIGRALLSQPELLLMDEPLAALDIARKRELMPYLEKLSQQVNIPILYVTHSMDEIIRLATQMVIIQQGKVVSYGSLSSLSADESLRRWLPAQQPSSIMRCQLVEQHTEYPMSRLALGQASLWVSRLEQSIGEYVTIQIYASDISLALTPPIDSSIRNILAAKIEKLIPSKLAGMLDIKLSVDQQILWARITTWAADDLKLQPNQRVYAQIKSVSLN